MEFKPEDFKHINTGDDYPIAAYCTVTISAEWVMKLLADRANQVLKKAISEGDCPTCGHSVGVKK